MPRTPEYDRKTVVDQAMAVFWERGYSQTSVGDLIGATGLNPGSLYAAFGSKKGVFVEVLDEYNRYVLQRISQMGSSNSAAIDDLKALLDEIVEDATGGDGRRGCLAVNAALEMSHHDADIAKQTEVNNQRIQQAFAAVLARAQAEGDIAKHKDADAMSAFLMNNIWGMRVMCKSKPQCGALAAVVDGVMASLRSE